MTEKHQVNSVRMSENTRIMNTVTASFSATVMLKCLSDQNA